MSRSQHIARWTPTRKLELVEAIGVGKLTADEACTLHSISPEELEGWIRDAATGNPKALRVAQAEHNRRRKNARALAEARKVA